MINIPNFIQRSQNPPNESTVLADELLLRQFCKEGMEKIISRGGLVAEEQVYWRRLEAELAIIIGKQYSSYFLIVADYVRWAVENNIGIGPGRGAGPCSMVGFVLGITKIDPILYGLPFERFVNPERDVAPDFDIDFCEQRCGEVRDYILARYGRDYVARICSDDGAPLNSRLVISEQPLSELVPVTRTEDTLFPITTMNMAQINELGLVRLNVIDQKAVTVNQCRLIELKRSGCYVDLTNMPLDNPDVYDLLCRGEPSNIDVLDQYAYKAAQLAVKPRTFSDLCATVAFSFPRTQIMLSEFKDCRGNAESMEFIHPALERITSETYGVILYQEQFMHIACDISGFTMAQADLFRRVLNGCDDKRVDAYKVAFIDGAVRFGFSHKLARHLYGELAAAAVRSVTKAHVVAYALLAYQGAWLKVLKASLHSE